MSFEQRSDFLLKSNKAEKLLSVGIDYFLNIAPNILENLKNNRKNSDFDKYSNTIIKYVDENDRDMAEFIANLHYTVYHNNYPYKEMQDSDYILKNFLQKNQAVVGVYNNKINNKLCGCGIFQLDYENKLAYIRSLMILNEDRDFIDVKKIFVQHIYEAIIKHINLIDKIYGEVRTAHNIVQYLSESIGFVPHAILINKDNFSDNNELESDILAITYTKKCLIEKRFNNPKIYFKLKNLYEHFENIWNLSPADYDKSEIKINRNFIKFVFLEYKNIIINKELDNYSYINYRMIHELYGVTMEFQVNSITKSAEKIKFKPDRILKIKSITNYEIFGAFILKLLKLIDTGEINYFEFYLPCLDVNLQYISKELGCSIFGYALAWYKLDNGKFVDCVVIGKSKYEINETKTHFTQKSKELFELIKPLL